MSLAGGVMLKYKMREWQRTGSTNVPAAALDIKHVVAARSATSEGVGSNFIRGFGFSSRCRGLLGALDGN